MSEFFSAKVFPRVLQHEGGYSNNRRDPGNWTGGKIGQGILKGTKFGIAASSYPDLDIEDLSLDTAYDIYLDDWWSKYRFDELHPALAFQVLDMAINSGPHNAFTCLQKVLGLETDGIMGSYTIATANKESPLDLSLNFNDARITFLTELRDFPVFGRGWMNRVALNLSYIAKDVSQT